MPRLDGTGPAGIGSQTGKKQGKCCSKRANVDENTIKPPFNLRVRRDKGRGCQNAQGGNSQKARRNKGLFN